VRPGSGSTKAAGDVVKVTETPAARGDGGANSHSDVKSEALQHTLLCLLLKRPESSEATNLLLRVKSDKLVLRVKLDKLVLRVKLDNIGGKLMKVLSMLG
jgi:hypothetical protein